MNRFLAASTVAMGLFVFTGTSASAQTTTPPTATTPTNTGNVSVSTTTPNSGGHAPERGVVSLPMWQALQAQPQSLNQKPVGAVAVEEPAMQNRPQKTVSSYKGALNMPVPANKQ